MKALDDFLASYRDVDPLPVLERINYYTGAIERVGALAGFVARRRYLRLALGDGDSIVHEWRSDEARFNAGRNAPELLADAFLVAIACRLDLLVNQAPTPMCPQYLLGELIEWSYLETAGSDPEQREILDALCNLAPAPPRWEESNAAR